MELLGHASVNVNREIILPPFLSVVGIDLAKRVFPLVSMEEREEMALSQISDAAGFSGTTPSS